MYKNRLQEFTQKANIQFPVYRTRNEGEFRHAPKFNCTVEVDGDKYSNLKTFPTRKAAEQDAARLALEGISKKIKNCVSNKTKDGGLPPIHEDRFFCKSILHEYCMKSNREKPTYDTSRLEGLLPVFVSSVVFGGVKYTGLPSVTKKQAEQLAARAVILSILADSGVDSPLSEIVKSKSKYFSAVHESYSLDTGVSQLPNSGSGFGMSTTKKRVYEDNELVENTCETGNTTGNHVSGITPESGVFVAQTANKVMTPESGVVLAQTANKVITSESAVIVAQTVNKVMTPESGVVVAQTANKVMTPESGVSVGQFASIVNRQESGVPVAQSASKAITSDPACEAGMVTEQAVSERVQVPCLLSHRHGIMEQNWAAFPQPSLQPFQVQIPSNGVDCEEIDKSKKKKKKTNNNANMIQMQV